MKVTETRCRTRFPKFQFPGAFHDTRQPESEVAPRSCVSEGFLEVGRAEPCGHRGAVDVRSSRSGCCPSTAGSHPWATFFKKVCFHSTCPGIWHPSPFLWGTLVTFQHTRAYWPSFFSPFSPSYLPPCLHTCPPWLSLWAPSWSTVFRLGPLAFTFQPTSNFLWLHLPWQHSAQLSLLQRDCPLCQPLKYVIPTFCLKISGGTPPWRLQACPVGNSREKKSKLGPAFAPGLFPKPAHVRQVSPTQVRGLHSAEASVHFQSSFVTCKGWNQEQFWWKG